MPSVRLLAPLLLAACAASPNRLELPSGPLSLPAPPPSWNAILAAQADRGVSGHEDALRSLLEQEDPATRARACFALGIDHPSAFETLRFLAAEDAEAVVRAAAVTACARARASEAVDVVAAGLDDPSALVRAAAASAAHLLPVGDEAPIELDQALVDAAADDADGEVRWRALFSLARRGVDHLAVYSKAVLPERGAWERLFATRGLSRVLGGTGVPADQDDARAALAVLLPVLEDDDWRVRYEAVRALLPRADGHATEPAAACLEDPSFHVRAMAVEVLGAARRLEERVRNEERVRDLRDDPSRTVRAAVVVAEARLEGTRAEKRVRALAHDDDPVLRAAALVASREVSPALAVELGEGLLGDANVRVAGTAVESLGSVLADPQLGERARAALHATLGSDDNGLRLAAVLALAPQVRPDELARLVQCFDSVEGDIAPEVRFNVVRAVASLAAAEPFLRRAQASAHRHVAQVAQDALLKRGIDLRTLRPLPAAVEPPPMPLFACEDPLVRLHTTGGDLLVQLFAHEAPRHVASFLQLARSGHYDGLTFHRVVSDFVVQGGCYRGDGNGAGTAWGRDAALPAEFNPIPYLTGALGMPRNEDPDSGGSQVFFTHRPTPHLDGRYTVFGQTIEGLDVLERLEIGDRILGVTVLDEVAPHAER